MARNLVIVESPAKAKTIKKFLGNSYQVIASNGHVRDLPKSQMGIDIDHDFEPKYITIRGKGELLAQLRKEVAKADHIYLATDPDREGEAISWHLYHTLDLAEKKTRRITFNEITKDVVKGALKQARDIDLDLVDAQQARRVLDRIVGYEISPILWKKVKKGLSAGRVQSATLKLLCDREDEINDFIPEEFWTLEAAFSKTGATGRLQARVASVDGEKLACGSEAEAIKIEERLRAAEVLTVEQIHTGRRSRRQPLPFTTSTLQQEASKHLNFTPAKTMQIAQQLYEGVEVKGHGTIGLITYLRTDSVRISEEARTAALEQIRADYGEEYADEARRNEQTGRIQDAHEAIRPTYADLKPADIADSVSRDQLRLYRLIWERFLAALMRPAEYETMQITVSGGGITLTASGSKLIFPGFLKACKDLDDEEEGELKSIKGLEEGDRLILEDLQKEQHFTQPPARFTEASLVHEMEENGLGRPSTYAPTITTILGRGYVSKEKKALYVTELGEIVNQIIGDYFPEIVDVRFTAQMEDRLDSVETGDLPWKQIVREFYAAFEPEVADAMTRLEKVEIRDEVTDEVRDFCGRNMVLKQGRFGRFYACPGFPECRNTKPYFEYVDATCPQCGGRIQIKRTRKGRVYYGCENYTTCDFMSWDQPTNEVCPDCGERLYKKNGRRRRLFCKKDGCGYFREIEEEE
ncbi:MAG: type I DNA topoisomerase [Firmicutes bacterium]|nr:type I DNA topoisomerase [Bacillota bacterium]